jgi:nitrilase
MSTQTVRAAVVQATPILFDTPATVDKVCKLCADAAGQGAQLAVFPEAMVGGYPKGLDFGATVGERQPEGRDQFLRYWEAAIEVPGKATARLGQAAREHNLQLVVGVIEREAGTLYCTVLFFDTEGNLAGKHRKLMPTAMERLIWGCGDGSTMPVLPTPLGRIGAVICWENYMPLLRMHMYSQGVQIYCAPTVDDRETWFPTMRHVALEGRCFVLSACQFLKHEDMPEELGQPGAGKGKGKPRRVDDTLSGGALIRGGSCIVDPLGQVLAGPSYGKEVILNAELDLSQIVRGKYDLDVTGHYARPDVFSLYVDDRPKAAVIAAAGAPKAVSRWLEAQTDQDGEEPSTQPFRRARIRTPPPVPPDAVEPTLPTSASGTLTTDDDEPPKE